MKPERELAADLERLGRTALIVGLIAGAICVVGAFVSTQQFFRSYLWAFVFWLNIPLGLLALLMLQHLVGGTWGAVLRGVLEGGARTIPFMAILFLPILFGIDSLYEWSAWTADEVAHNEILQHKAQYLNSYWFTLRAILYFAVWSFFVWLLMRWSYVQQHGGNPKITRWLAKLSGVGMLVGGLCVTFSSVDWVMSLEPLWFSTIYGLLFVTSEFVTGMAFAILLTAYMNRYEPLGGVVRENDFQDLGSLLLAFVIIWTYISFSQFLIIWTGDIVEELTWYLRRLRNGWGWIALALLLFHFVLPFFALLSKRIKRDPRWIGRVALLILFMHAVNVYWLVKPSFNLPQVAAAHSTEKSSPAHGPSHADETHVAASHSETSHSVIDGALPLTSAVSFFDLAAIVAVGGLWLSLFSWQLRRQPAVLVFERSS